MTAHLEYVVVKDGQIVSSKTLAEKAPDSLGIEPSFGRFHISKLGELYVVIAGTSIGGGQRLFGNYIGRVYATREKPEFEPIDLKHPFHSFFTNTPRGGSQPSNVLDLFGMADDHPNLRYARIRIEPYED